jgi:hypothetical protein
VRPALRAIVAPLIVCLAVAIPASARAQQRPPQTQAKPAPAKAKPKKPKKPRPPMFLTAGASAQVSGNNPTQALSYPLYGETATATGPVAFGVTPAADFGFGVQVGKRLSLGAGFSFSGTTGQLNATFSVPHPLIFGANRTADGSAQADRRVGSLDIELALVLAGGKAWRVEVVGGPTLSWVHQQLAVDALTIVEGDYPYDTVTLQPSGSSDSHSDFSFGGHIGMRLTRQFNHRTGVTIGVRWRAIPFHPEIDGAVQQLSASGLHVGGAIKFVF